MPKYKIAWLPGDGVGNDVMEATRKVLDALKFDAEYIHGITVWGWIFGQTWSMAPDSGLIRNGAPRPAMTWLMDTLGRESP